MPKSRSSVMTEVVDEDEYDESEQYQGYETTDIEEDYRGDYISGDDGELEYDDDYGDQQYMGDDEPQSRYYEDDEDAEEEEDGDEEDGDEEIPQYDEDEEEDMDDNEEAGYNEDAGGNSDRDKDEEHPNHPESQPIDPEITLNFHSQDVAILKSFKGQYAGAGKHRSAVVAIAVEKIRARRVNNEPLQGRQKRALPFAVKNWFTENCQSEAETRAAGKVWTVKDVIKREMKEEVCERRDALYAEWLKDTPEGRKEAKANEAEARAKLKGKAPATRKGKQVGQGKGAIHFYAAAVDQIVNELSPDALARRQLRRSGQIRSQQWRLWLVRPAAEKGLSKELQALSTRVFKKNECKSRVFSCDGLSHPQLTFKKLWAPHPSSSLMHTSSKDRPLWAPSINGAHHVLKSSSGPAPQGSGLPAPENVKASAKALMALQLGPKGDPILLNPSKTPMGVSEKTYLMDLFWSFIVKSYAIAMGTPGVRVTVPWAQISREPRSFLSEEYFPDGMIDKLGDPSDMNLLDLARLLCNWFKSQKALTRQQIDAPAFQFHSYFANGKFHPRKPRALLDLGDETRLGRPNPGRTVAWDASVTSAKGAARSNNASPHKGRSQSTAATRKQQVKLHQESQPNQGRIKSKSPVKRSSVQREESHRPQAISRPASPRNSRSPAKKASGTASRRPRQESVAGQAGSQASRQASPEDGKRKKSVSPCQETILSCMLLTFFNQGLLDRHKGNWKSRAGAGAGYHKGKWKSRAGAGVGHPETILLCNAKSPPNPLMPKAEHVEMLMPPLMLLPAAHDRVPGILMTTRGDAEEEPGPARRRRAKAQPGRTVTMKVREDEIKPGRKRERSASTANARKVPTKVYENDDYPVHPALKRPPPPPVEKKKGSKGRGH
ncbi:hypothetical protein DFP72DRAFT_861441 [Ephemerocybe angulata]|uniref:Uncharacterized protein n=1 Tax=Ephemerocybe angulata TaxID=980116 RepID=A0A8H6LUQ7_9AGAR|nr:hypothetical protein DFP72DRAFT_861441 [Tulosesus angulatus]